MQRELQLAFGESFARVSDRFPCAVIEHVDVPGAIIAFGDVALESRVGDRVIFDLHRQALDAGIEARSLRHRPTFQRAIELQAEVVMAMGRMVKLDDEDALFAACAARGRFGRRDERSLAFVFCEAHAGDPRAIVQIDDLFRSCRFFVVPSLSGRLTRAVFLGQGKRKRQTPGKPTRKINPDTRTTAK